VNAALIAGNPPENRVEKLREFWEAVSTPPLGVPHLAPVDIKDDAIHRVINQTRALGIMMFGAPHFFTPRLLSPLIWPSPNADQLSFYDVAPLKATLERLVDFDRLNAGAMRFSVGALNVKTANFVYFDSTTHRTVRRISSPVARCRPVFRPPRSTANIIGTAVSFSTRHCNGCQARQAAQFSARRLGSDMSGSIVGIAMKRRVLVTLISSAAL
jgi:hypothetical protein